VTQTIDWQSYFHCSQQYLHQINSSSEFASLVFSPFNTHWNRINIFSIEYNLLPILRQEYRIVRIIHRDTNDRSTVTTSLLAAISTSDKFTQWIFYLIFQCFNRHWNPSLFSIEYNLLHILPQEYSIVRIIHRDTNDYYIHYNLNILIRISI